jgi:nucleotidyltransferase substrate binding protein (TIGR01987 family)
MSARKLRDSLNNLKRAMSKLGEAVQLPRDSPLVAEGTIQRFEFVFELFWKTVKRALEYEGRTSKTPRESIKEAYALGWINNEVAWLDMLDCRNTTSHLYLHPELVEDTYLKIVSYFPQLSTALNFLCDRYGNILQQPNVGE